MVNHAQEKQRIANWLANERLRQFVTDNLTESLGSIGCSKELIEGLTGNLASLNVKAIQERFASELESVYRVGFFQNIVPAYFLKWVAGSDVPPRGRVLDVGCGTGILLHALSRAEYVDDMVGIDIHSYPEWAQFQNQKTRFQVVAEEQFPSFLDEVNADTVILTWTLHHMEYEEQERYVATLFTKMKHGSKLILLEDAYSEDLAPESGERRWESFMKWGVEDRKRIMSIYDWVANRVLAQRDQVPIPFAYRTMEGWIALFEKMSFTFGLKTFIGFPDQRDINTPQSLMIFSKP